MSCCPTELDINYLKERVANVKRATGDLIPNFNENYIIATRVFRTITKRVEQEMESDMAKFDLPGEAWIVLMATYSSDKQTIIANDICHHLNKNKSTTSRIIDSLIKKQYLKRFEAEDDRRKVLLTITDEGKKFVLNRLPVHADFYNALWSGVDVDAMLENIQLLHSNLKTATMSK